MSESPTASHREVDRIPAPGCSPEVLGLCPRCLCPIDLPTGVCCYLPEGAENFLKCSNCKKGRPTLWIDGKGFCDEGCYEDYLSRRNEVLDALARLEDMEY